MGADGEPLPAAGQFTCKFFWDFPALLFSDLGPGCRTFTPRINCDIYFDLVLPKTLKRKSQKKKKKKKEGIKPGAYIFSTLNVWVDDYEISFLESICFHKISWNQ